MKAWLPAQRSRRGAQRGRPGPQGRASSWRRGEEGSESRLRLDGVRGFSHSCGACDLILRDDSEVSNVDLRADNPREILVTFGCVDQPSMTSPIIVPHLRVVMLARTLSVVSKASKLEFPGFPNSGYR